VVYDIAHICFFKKVANMRVRCSFCLWLFVLIAFYGGPTYAQQQTTITLTANDIMRMVVENWKKNELLKSALISFERRHIEHELDRGGNQKSIKKDETSYHGKLYSSESGVKNGGLSINLNAILFLSYDYVFLNPNSPDYTNLPDK